MRNFKRNNSGIAPIIAIAACALVMLPIIYITLGLALDNVADTFFAQYTLTGTPESAWLLVRALISALPIFVVLIVIAWGLVNAKARSYE